MDVDEDSRPSPTPLRQGTATFGELAEILKVLGNGTLSIDDLDVCFSSRQAQRDAAFNNFGRGCGADDGDFLGTVGIGKCHDGRS